MTSKDLIQIGALVSAIAVVVTFGKDALETFGFKGETPLSRIEAVETRQAALKADLVEAEEGHEMHHAAEQKMWDTQEIVKDSSRRMRTELIESLVIDLQCADTTKSDSDLARLKILDDCRRFGAR